MHRFKRIATAIVGGTVLSPGHAMIVLPAPAFRAHVHLAVPGPDIHAAVGDDTLEAAGLKVSKKLHPQIERRRTLPRLPVTTQRQAPLAAGQRA